MRNRRFLQPIEPPPGSARRRHPGV